MSQKRYEVATHLYERLSSEQLAILKAIDPTNTFMCDSDIKAMLYDLMQLDLVVLVCPISNVITVALTDLGKTVLTLNSVVEYVHAQGK